MPDGPDIDRLDASSEEPNETLDRPTPPEEAPAAFVPAALQMHTPSLLTVAIPFALVMLISVAILIIAVTQPTRDKAENEADSKVERVPQRPDANFRHELEQHLRPLAPVLGTMVMIGLCFMCALLSRRFRHWLLPPPRNAPRVSWGLMELAQVGAMAFVLMVMGRVLSLRLDEEGALRIITYLLPQLALGASLLILWLRTALPRTHSAEPESVLASLGLTLGDPRDNLLRGVAGYLILLPLSAAIANVAEHLSNVFELSKPVHPVIEEIVSAGTADTVTLVLTASIAAPVMEEIFFRGFIYATIRERLGVPFGMAVSALLFASVHGGFANQAVTGVMGIYLAAVYERSGSLVVPIAVHALFNGVQMAMVLIAFGAG